MCVCVLLSVQFTYGTLLATTFALSLLCVRVQARWKDAACRAVAAKTREQWCSVEWTGLPEKPHQETLHWKVSHLLSKLPGTLRYYLHWTFECAYAHFFKTALLCVTCTGILTHSHRPFLFVGVEMWACPSQLHSIHLALHIITSQQGPKQDH